MTMIKAAYVSLYLTAAIILTGYAAYQLWLSPNWPSAWLGAFIAGLGPTLYFARLFALPTARTAPQLRGLLVVGVLGSLIAFALGGVAATVLAVLIGIVGTLLYDNWYSHFGSRSDAVLAPGKMLPKFSLRDADGQLHSSEQLSGQATVWMFYRGNWCPFCVAQIKEVAALYRQLEARGARVILVSPQSEQHTRSLAKKFDVPMQFLIDVDNQAAKTLDIFSENGLPTGIQALGYDSDVPMPTVFITDETGKILYADLAENYRIRPEPDEFLRVLDEAGSTA